MSEFRIIEGDALPELQRLDPQSVQTCITSPPYWGLRDYGTATWEGGDPECGHSPERPQRAERPRGGLTGGLDYVAAQDGGATAQQTCDCGARRIDSQLGLEPTPEEYVQNLVAVFREVRRVLRDDGTLWLNLGDSYNNRSVARPSSHQGGLGFDNESIGRSWADGTKLGLTRLSLSSGGLKEKDLVGIPWRVAFALQADGWWLRSEIVWSKPNPMPESVTDRPTRAHEQVFLLTKSARYYYDADAIREDAVAREPGEMDGGPQRTIEGGDANDGRNFRKQDGYTSDSAGRRMTGFNDRYFAKSAPFKRNKRSVWTVATQPYPDAHFATFPPKLVEPMVLAGSKPDDTILDPFAGAGTTGVVALRHDRDFIGIELNPTYAEMTRRRIFDDGPLLNVEAA